MSISDDFIKHKIFLQRYIRTDVKKYLMMLNEMFNIIDNSVNVNPTNNKLKALRLELELLFGHHTNNVFKHFQSLYNYETDFATKLLQKWTKEEIASPDIRNIRNLYFAFKTRGDRYKMDDAYSSFNRGIIDRTIITLTDNVDKDIALASIGTLITGRMISRYASLSSTAINTISTESHLDTFEANANIIEQVEWNAVLDDSTCPDCEMLDGMAFDIGAVEEDCPLHANCRCELVPIVINEGN